MPLWRGRRHRGGDGGGGGGGGDGGGIIVPGPGCQGWCCQLVHAGVVASQWGRCRHASRIVTPSWWFG